MKILRKQSSVLVVSGLAMMLFFSSCATRGYARRQAAKVDAKVTQLATTVQENAERLDATDARARQGIADARAAQTTANQAAAAAALAQSAAASAQANADAANLSAQAAAARAASMDNRVVNTTFQGNIDRYDAGPIATVMFKVGKSELSGDAKKILDGIVAPIAGQDSGYLVEISGFASAEGLETMNANLSRERSESVQRYLVSKGASITRVSVVGLGADRPIGDNTTKSGREQNRRAEIRVYSAAAK